MKTLILAALLCVSSLAYAQATGGQGVPGAGGGGGGSLPTATAAGQIYASTAAGTTAAVQPSDVYWNSGDTIASINANTLCATACVYHMTGTVAVAATASLNAAIAVVASGGGTFNVSSGQTLTLGANFSSPDLKQHFSGSGSVVLSAYNSLVPVEWFGAVGDWNGTTGTNNLTAIQSAYNATTYGQILLQPLNYAIAGTLTTTRDFVGIRGAPAWRGGQFGLVETVAGDNAVNDIGYAGGYFEDFTIKSSVAQTGTASGFTCDGAAGLTVRNVLVQDFFYDFYLHQCPSGAAGFFDDTAQWTSLSSGLTGPVGYYMPSTDGNAEDSLTLRDSWMTTTPTGGPSTAIGALITGTAVNDIDLFNFNVAGGNGIEIVYTGTGSGFACSDIHIVTPTIDNFSTSGIVVNGCLASQTGGVEISGGWVVAGPGTSSANGAIYVLNSSGVSVNHVQIGAHAGAGNAALYGVNISGGSGNSVVGNTCLNQPFCVNLILNTVGNTVVGNTLINTIGSTINVGMQLNSGASYNNLSSNTFTGANTIATGISIPTDSNNNTYVGNTCGSNVTTCISDSGTGNGAINFISAAKGSSVANSANSTSGTSPNLYSAYQAYGPVSIQGNNTLTPTAAWAIGFNVPGGTPDTNTHFDVWNGTTWNNGFTVNNSTLATAFAGAVTAPSIIPGTIYSAAGTALPTCAVGIKGETAVVSDATTPTYMGAYTSGGAITTAVICSFDGTTYAWKTH